VGAWEADFPDAEGILGPLAALIESLAPDAEREAEIRNGLATAVATHDRDERLRLFREVDRILVRDVVTIVPLGYPASRVAVRPWIEGITWSSGGWWNLDRAVVRRPAS
jgi:ABC-type oligopeptide transport system substrate-binding subunit